MVNQAQRTEIEKLALRLGVKLDGIADDLTAMRVVLTRVPGVDANGSPAYVRAAIEALAAGERRDGAEEKARTVEQHSAAASHHAAEAARLEKGGYMTAADAHAAAAKAHERAAALGGEDADPVSSRAARNTSLKASVAGVTHAKPGARVDGGAERVARLDAAPPSAKAARERMALDAENAWRSPLAARVDDGGADARADAPRIDRTMSVEALKAATAAVRRKARADSEKEWQRPLRSDAHVEA